MREQFSLPGMKVLVFAFDSGSKNPFLPHHHMPDNVVYTGTHDNDTVLGWYRRAEPEERDFYRRYLDTSDEAPHWELIRAAWASVGVYALAPLQDFLGLGNEARMNYPGRPSGNWQWRMPKDALTGELARKLAELNSIYGRDEWQTQEGE
jgi:4-alpha-glucanotransferase